MLAKLTAENMSRITVNTDNILYISEDKGCNGEVLRVRIVMGTGVYVCVRESYDEVLKRIEEVLS